MKQYAFVEWDLVRSTPMRHTYRCGWRELLWGGKIYRAAKRPRRRRITIEWDGTERLIVRSGKNLALQDLLDKQPIEGHQVRLA